MDWGFRFPTYSATFERAEMAKSPYAGLSEDRWLATTKKLVAKYPITMTTVAKMVFETWDAIFESTIGRYAKIGVHIFPTPQMMGIFLHELIPLEFAAKFPDEWKRGEAGNEKDLVYLPDNSFSTEIKCSSHKKSIFANRSYAQAPSDSKKSKSGYYLAVNFEQFSESLSQPKIRMVRFGWLDHGDWIGQRAETGQQARLNPATESLKLLRIDS